MRKVILRNDQRHQVSQSELQPAAGALGDQGFWSFQCQHSDAGLEVMLPGGDGGPDSTWLDLVERVIGQVGSFVTEATEYLQAFIDVARIQGPADERRRRSPASLEPGREWDLIAVEFGRRHDDLHERDHPFELVFSLGDDTYGEWRVGFYRTGSDQGFYPYEFRRIQV